MQVVDFCVDFVFLFNIVLLFICLDGNNGEIGLMISGGDGNYIYVWSNGVEIEDLDMLFFGLYIFIVMDGNDCEVSGSFWLQGEIVLFDILFISCSELMFVFGLQNVDGEVSVDIMGIYFFFDIFVDDDFWVMDVSIGVLVISDFLFGDYLLEVVDSVGCS